jgi:hypothetical protein
MPVAAAASTRAPGATELQEEIEALKDRVAYLEQQLGAVLSAINDQSTGTAAAPAGSAAAAGEPREHPGVASIEHSAIDVGGRVKLDAVYNSRSTGGASGANSGDLEFFPATIPIGTGGEDDQISLNARQTRLWLKGYTPSDYGEMAGYIEIDFDSSAAASNEKVSNSFIPRLRHAYATVAGLTLGQTYTTFMQIAAFPEVNDLNGPVGMLNIRQPLLRYTMNRGWGSFAIALENPETTLTAIDGSRIAPDDDRVPDLVGRIDWFGDLGEWSISGLVREIRSDGTSPAAAGDHVWGGAVNASGRLDVAGRDQLRFGVSYGNALGRYLSYNAFDDGTADITGNIHLTPIFGGYLAFQHWWNDTLRSTVAAGYAHADHRPLFTPGTANEDFFSTHVNLIWNPGLNATVGIEWLHAYRERVDGRSGNLDRIQLTSIYKF